MPNRLSSTRRTLWRLAFTSTSTAPASSACAVIPIHHCIICHASAALCLYHRKLCLTCTWQTTSLTDETRSSSQKRCAPLLMHLFVRSCFPLYRNIMSAAISSGIFSSTTSGWLIKQGGSKVGPAPSALAASACMLPFSSALSRVCLGRFQNVEEALVCSDAERAELLLAAVAQGLERHHDHH